MGPNPSQLSASATQIYPSSRTHSNSHSHSQSQSPSSPPHSSSTHSDFQLNPLPNDDHHDHVPSGHGRRLQILNFTRLALTVLAVAAGAAVVGCETHVLSV